MQIVEAHGARIPQIGFGTMTLKGDICVQAVKTALQIGYRHLDTAAFYGNEVESGEGLRQSGILRDEVFICTKVRRQPDAGELQSSSLDQEVLANLKLPYVDLLLIHWNSGDMPFKTRRSGRCAQAERTAAAKHVGVANFTTKMLDEAWAVTSEPLVCNQIEEDHPLINQDKVLAASGKHGMAVVAYVPIARGKVPGAEALERIGKAHGKTAAQVSLRYLVQLGCCAIPRAANPAHMKENLEVFDFNLWDGQGMAELEKLNATNMRVVSPPHAPVCGIRLDTNRARFRLVHTADAHRRWRKTINRTRGNSAAIQDCVKTKGRPWVEVGAMHRHYLGAVHQA